jgi:hypothetical protein
LRAVRGPFFDNSAEYVGEVQTVREVKRKSLLEKEICDSFLRFRYSVRPKRIVQRALLWCRLRRVSWLRRCLTDTEQLFHIVWYSWAWRHAQFGDVAEMRL